MLNQILGSAITLLLFFVLLFGYTKLAGPIPFSVNSVSTTKSSTFDVTGEGRATIKPDRAQVSAGVQATGTSSAQVQDQLNSTINKVTSAITGVGIDKADIQTANYNINPTYDYNGGNQKITGYSASTNLTVTVKDISKINAVIDAATTAGANNVNNLGFDNKDDSGARDQARKLAVEDAKKKAANIANIAGFRLGNIINYSEGGQGPSGPMPVLLRSDKAIGGAPTEVQPGTNEVIVTATLSYEVR